MSADGVLLPLFMDRSFNIDSGIHQERVANTDLPHAPALLARKHPQSHAKSSREFHNTAVLGVLLCLVTLAVVR